MKTTTILGLITVIELATTWHGASVGLWVLYGIYKLLKLIIEG